MTPEETPNTPRYMKWIIYAAVAFLLIGILLAIIFIAGCAVPTYKSWERAEVKQTAMAQQDALEKDREACINEGTAKGVYYQALMGSLDLTACLERRGWKRVP